MSITSDNKCGFSPIFIMHHEFIQACCYGHFEAAKYLAHKCDINYRDRAGLTGLTYAAINKHIKIVKWLLKRNATIYFGDLINVNYSRSTKMIKYFIKRGAKLYEIDHKDCWTTLSQCNSNYIELLSYYRSIIFKRIHL